MTPPVPGQHNHAEPCRCVYPNACFCTPQQKALRDPGLDPPGQHNHAAETAEALREEWEALALISYSGDGHGGWVPDLGRDDIEAIRALLQRAATALAAAEARLAETERQRDEEKRAWEVIRAALLQNVHDEQDRAETAVASAARAEEALRRIADDLTDSKGNLMAAHEMSMLARRALSGGA